MNNAYVEAPPMQPRLSGASLMVARVMLRDGYEPGMGLGQNGNGTTSLVRLIENHKRFSLGYEPTHADKRRVTLERKERSLALYKGRDHRWRGSLSATLAKALLARGGCMRIKLLC